jgi:hypothetical protein
MTIYSGGATRPPSSVLAQFEFVAQQLQDALTGPFAISFDLAISGQNMTEISQNIEAVQSVISNLQAYTQTRSAAALQTIVDAIKNRNADALNALVEFAQKFARDNVNSIEAPFFDDSDIAGLNVEGSLAALSKSIVTGEQQEASGRASLSFNPGAGWGGVSFTNEGGIATINSQGRISWSGLDPNGAGAIAGAQSHFSSGAAALAALAGLLGTIFGTGRTDAPPGAPPAPPDDPGDPGDSR